MALLARLPLESVQRQKLKALLFYLLAIVTMAGSLLSHAAQRGPDVVIIAEENRMVYEFRQNGQLRMIRVVPSFGKPYTSCRRILPRLAATCGASKAWCRAGCSGSSSRPLF